MQMPFRASGAQHAAHRHHRLAVAVVGQVPHRLDPPGIGAGRSGERRDVLGSRALGQGRQFCGILPGQLAGQAIRVRAGCHQPGEPACRRLIEVLMQVVGHAAQVTRQVDGAPLRARRQRVPPGAGDLGSQFTGDYHAGVVRRQRGTRCPIRHGPPPESVRSTVPPLPATGAPGCEPRASQRARVTGLPPPRSGLGFSPGEALTTPPVTNRAQPRCPRRRNPGEKSDDSHAAARLASR